MAKIIINTDSISHTYAGQIITSGSSYTIQAVEQIRFANDDDLMNDIATGKAQVNDGTSDISGVNNQINFLKDIDSSPRDVDGALLSRNKVTTSGWSYQRHGFEIETSQLNSVYSKKYDLTDTGFVTIKCYDIDNVEIIDQGVADTDCVKTIINWEPTYNYEILGGEVRQKTVPTEDVRVWVIGVPDVSAAYGGSKEFILNANLAYIGLEEGIKSDGRAPKLLNYNATYHTNKIQAKFIHSAGFKHKLHIMFEIFKV